MKANETNPQTRAKNIEYTEVGQSAFTDNTDSSPSRKSTIFIYLLVFIASVITFYFCFIKTGLMPRFMTWLEVTLAKMYMNGKFEVLSILFVIIFVMIVLALPCQTFICILASLIIKNVWLNFVFLTLTSVLASLGIYFLARKLIYSYLLRKLQHNKYYLVLKDEAYSSPWKSALITRIMYIPVGLKDYILVMVDIPLLTFFISSIIGHSIYISELLLVANEIKNINELFQEGKSWSDKDGSQKASFVFGITIMAFTLGFMGYLSCWAKKKVALRGNVITNTEINIKN